MKDSFILKVCCIQVNVQMSSASAYEFIGQAPDFKKYRIHFGQCSVTAGKRSYFALETLYPLMVFRICLFE